MHIALKTDELVAIFKGGFANLIQILAGADVTVLSKTEEPPEGCAVNVVNESCDIHLLLKVHFSFFSLSLLPFH